MQRVVLLLMLSCTLAAPAGAQQPADSAETRAHRGFVRRAGDTIRTWVGTPLTPKRMKWKAVVIPSILITYGTLTGATGWLEDVNLLGRKWASNNEDPNRKTRIDDFTQNAQPVAVLALNIAGVRGRNNLLDAGVLYGLSWGLANTFTYATKNLTTRIRPDSSDALSFPSGHTTTAFVGAEFLRQEYRHVSPWIGVAGYAVAIGTGYLRMYNNKHWLSDVVAGAGVGILSTRLTYLLYPRLKNWVIGKKAPGSAMVVPYWNGGPGIYAAYRFR